MQFILHKCLWRSWKRGIGIEIEPSSINMHEEHWLQYFWLLVDSFAVVTGKLMNTQTRLLKTMEFQSIPLITTVVSI